MHIWAFAETLGLVATNHEAILSESLQGFANGQTSKPVTVVTTMARAILESLAVQAWLIDPTIATKERYTRWIALKYQSERDSWRIAHPHSAHLNNPAARELLLDARTLDLAVDQRSAPTWIGTRIPSSTELAGRLTQWYAHYTGREAAGIDAIGETFYRLFSGEIHVRVGSVFALLLPTDTFDSSGHPMHTYDLSHKALWNTMSLVLISTFAARCTYVEWLGIPVDDDVRRLHIHHVELAVRKAVEGNCGFRGFLYTRSD